MPRPKKQFSFYIMLLCALGLIVSLWLTYVHVRVHLDPMYESVCAVGKVINCESVAISKFSVIAHIPLSVLAAVFYFVLGSSTLLASKSKTDQYKAITALLGLSAGIVSLIFLGISSIFIGAFCPGCTVVHLINFSLTFITVRRAQQAGNFIKNLKSDFFSLAKNHWTSGQLAALLLLFITASPLGGFPRYWETASWRTGVVLNHGIEKGNFPWIGARDPLLVIHEFFDFECPACRSSHKKLRRLLSDRSDRLRIIRHDMPRVECVDDKGVGIDDRCAAARAAFCAAAQNRFWDFNDAFVADPKPEKIFSRKQHILELAEHLGFEMTTFSACLDTPETFFHVQKIYEDGMKREIKSLPTYFVENKKMTSKQVISTVKSM
jgi:uncharacterized membrane protein/predicted DsbA family dithiol-disulfide isomerase